MRAEALDRDSLETGDTDICDPTVLCEVAATASGGTHRRAGRSQTRLRKKNVYGRAKVFTGRIGVLIRGSWTQNEDEVNR